LRVDPQKEVPNLLQRAKNFFTNLEDAGSTIVCEDLCKLG